MDFNKEIHVQTRKCTNNMDTSVKNTKGTKKCYAQCGKFSVKCKRAKQSPFQKLESFWMRGLKNLESEEWRTEQLPSVNKLRTL